MMFSVIVFQEVHRSVVICKDRSGPTLLRAKLKLEKMEEKLNCIDAELATIFGPCGHACYCQVCADKPALAECLVC